MEFNFENLKEKMDGLGVAGIFLFGSRAQGTARANSDYDFAILMRDKRILADIKQRKIIYDALYDILSAQVKSLRDIDIVFVQNVDLQLRYRVAKDGQLLYTGDKKIVYDFLEQTMESYADFAPLRRIFQQTTLARV